MKISIIIPAYNCEQYLENCLESIINQSYKDIEIILVDDGSTDRTGEICNRYSDTYDFIQVIHQKNQGVSHARNTGMKYITGDYVSFIDADDTVDTEMYVVLLDIIRKYDVEIAHCGYKHVVGEEIRFVHDTGKIYSQNHEEALECLIGGSLFVGSLWNKLYKRELLDHVSFDENLKINEDILFNYIVFNKVTKSVFIDKALYNYIAHKGQSAVFITADKKKSQDATRVSRYIYYDSSDERVKATARERYLRSLSGYFRVVFKQTALRKRISKEMWKVSNAGPGAGKNMRLTTWMIKFVPHIYLLVYATYNKIRKPNWEV